jgi:hypothetical protein
LNAQIIAHAIGLARPERAIRLSQVAGRGVDVEACPPEEAWLRIRRRVNRVREILKGEGFRSSEWAYHVERNPKGTGYHAHAWQHGDYIPQATLQEVCRRADVGIPRIERLRKTGAVAYGVKAITYGLKDAEAVDARREFLQINGGRMVHATRDFWRDEHGERCTGLEARAAAVRLLHDESSDREHWFVVEHGRPLESVRAQRLRDPSDRRGRLLV